MWFNLPMRQLSIKPKKDTEINNYACLFIEIVTSQCILYGTKPQEAKIMIGQCSSQCFGTGMVYNILIFLRFSVYKFENYFFNKVPTTLGKN